jgi:hypothetical protein
MKIKILILKSVKSINPFKSVIQTCYDIVKARGGAMSVRTPSEKLETKEGEGSDFVITLPL